MERATTRPVSFVAILRWSLSKEGAWPVVLKGTAPGSGGRADGVSLCSLILFVLSSLRRTEVAKKLQD